MALVLAINPDSTQEEALQRLTSDLAGHEIVFVTTYLEALAAIERQVPDLILFPLFFSPSEEAAIMSRMGGAAGADQFRALRIPLLASATVKPSTTEPRWFYWFKPPPTDETTEHCDPRVFADEIRAYLEQHTPAPPPVREVRKAGPIKEEPPPEWARPPEIFPDEAPAPRMAPTALLSESDHATALRNWSEEVQLEKDRAAANRAATEPPKIGPIEAMKRAVAEGPRLSAPSRPMLADPPPAAPKIPGDARPPAPALAPLPGSRPLSLAGPVAAAKTQTRSVPAPDVEPRAASRPPDRQRTVRRSFRVPRKIWILAAAAAVLIGVGVTFGDKIRSTATTIAKPRTGVADLQSTPQGSEVWADGKKIGVTPFSATLPAGLHKLEFRYRGASRVVALEVAAGRQMTHSLDWKLNGTGQLTVSTPDGATVIVDGQKRGVAPLTIEDLAPGKHNIVLETSNGTVRRTVTIKPNETASVEASIYSGWAAVFSPIELQISANGRAIRLDEQHQAMLPPGRHELRLANEALGYSDVRTVEITPGEVTNVTVIPPKAMVSVSSTPPAEVWVDGARVGETPLADLPVDIGTREFVFKHPTLGERKFTTAITTAPRHIDLDLTATP